LNELPGERQLDELIAAAEVQVQPTSLTANGWALVDARKQALLDKLRAAGKPLGDYVGGKIYRGILTGLNEAFVIDAATRDQLIAADPNSAEVIKPFLAGKDIKRYVRPVSNKYLILFPKGSTVERVGKNVPEDQAWLTMKRSYPAISLFLEPFADRARKRTDQGDYWWELRACDYYSKFLLDKILYPDIAPRPSFQLSHSESYCGNTGYFIPGADAYLLAVLNSSAFEFYYATVSSIMRGGYFRFFTQYVEAAPIPTVTSESKEAVVRLVNAIHEGNLDAERLIDEHVYRFYDLTAEEVALVEAAVGRG
jgi:adenine-specific DNA-methyltransferase